MAYVVNQVDSLDSEGKPSKEDLVAYVRTSDGTVKLNSGDTVPPEADEVHGALLVEQGVLSEKSEPKPSGGGKPPTGKD